MSDENEQKKLYDAACKRILSEKGIIAQILQGCVNEFRDCSTDDIIHKYIQGTPEVSSVVVEPNGTFSRIENQHTEDKSESEGTVFYDVRFNAVAPDDGDLIELIINIEAQNAFNPGYPLLKRAIYYCSRMISSQYGTVFVKSDYGKIKKVYSIWICTFPTKNWEYTITKYHMEEDNFVGEAHEEKKNYDLLEAIMICLGKKSSQELNGLLSMLNLVLLDNLNSEEKKKLLTDRFKVKVTPNLEQGVAKLCNLSEGIERRGEERGIAIGEARGRAEGKAEGRAEGEARLARLIHELMISGRSQDTILAVSDTDARQRLYHEFHIE